MEDMFLPVEIWRLVFDYLIQQDLKKVRLVNRTLHNLVNLRITRVLLSPNRTNIDAFCGIAANETFRDQVREIIWDDARLESYKHQKLSEFDALRLREELSLGGGDSISREKTFQHFVQKTEAQAEDLNEKEAPAQKEELWGANTKEMSLEESLDLYNRLYDEQQAIIESGEDAEALALGLTSFLNLERVTISSETWRIRTFFPRFPTPFFRSLPPGFQMPLPWPWLGRDSDDLPEDAIEKLPLPWDDTQQEWRGYQVAISALLSTSPHHNVTELVVDTNSELTGLSHQLFASSEQNTGYTTTVQLFRTVPLTRLELSLNTTTAEETDFACFHNGLLKTALSHLSSLKHLALSTSIDTADDDDLLDLEEAWVNVDEILPVRVLQPKLESLTLRNFLLHGESLFSALTNLTSLSRIQLDCVALSEDLTWRKLWFQVKDNFVGMWKPGQPAVIFRRKASSLDLRLDSSAELTAFLYGKGECSFTEEVPQVTNVGWVVSNWDPGYREYMGPLRNFRESET